MSIYDNADRVIREQGPTGSFETAQKNYDASLANARAAASLAGTEGSTAPERVLFDYRRRPLMPSDPASSSGVQIDMTELAPDVIAAINAGGSGGVTRLPRRGFAIGTPPAANDPMDINTGTFNTAGAQATISGYGTLALPATAVQFRDDNRVRVWLDGQVQIKGANPGDPNTDVYMVSPTKIAFNSRIYAKSVIEIETLTAF